jgi:hypothetical protein
MWGDLPWDMGVNMKRKQDPRELSVNKLTHIVLGWNWSFIGEDSREFPFENEEERKKLYFKYKDYIFSKQGEKEDFANPAFKYGQRPAAWWDYEAPIKRIDIPKKSPVKVWMGMAGWKISQNHERNEYIYLKENNFLLPGEEEKMRAQMRREKLQREGMRGKRSDELIVTEPKISDIREFQDGQ